MRIGDAGGTNTQQSVIRSSESGLAGKTSGRARAEQGKEKDETEQSVKLDISESVQEMFQRQAEESREASKENGDKIAEYGKILEIARRIARGDKVPPRDEKKLMEYSAELYQMAKSAAMLNAMKKHKKYKSLFEDEDGKDMAEKLRALDEEDGGQGGSDTTAASTEAGEEESSTEES